MARRIRVNGSIDAGHRRIRRQTERHGYFLFVALGAIVLAFMGLSLAITAIGTARLAVAMGYSAQVGYAVGAIFDFAKALLPVALLLLVARRAFLLFSIIACAWLGLVTYSALATHATVSTAIAAIERSGSWKMVVRSETKAELGAVEKRLAILAQPFPPRSAFRGRKEYGRGQPVLVRCYACEGKGTVGSWTRGSLRWSYEDCEPHAKISDETELRWTTRSGS